MRGIRITIINETVAKTREGVIQQKNNVHFAAALKDEIPCEAGEAPPISLSRR